MIAPWVNVSFHGDRTGAELVAERLAREGISAAVTGNGILPGLGTTFAVCVPPESVDQARSLLATEAVDEDALAEEAMAASPTTAAMLAAQPAHTAQRSAMQAVRILTVALAAAVVVLVVLATLRIRGAESRASARGGWTAVYAATDRSRVLFVDADGIQLEDGLRRATSQLVYAPVAAPQGAQQYARATDAVMALAEFRCGDAHYRRLVARTRFRDGSEVTTEGVDGTWRSPDAGSPEAAELAFVCAARDVVPVASGRSEACPGGRIVVSPGEPVPGVRTPPRTICMR